MSQSGYSRLTANPTAGVMRIITFIVPIVMIATLLVVIMVQALSFDVKPIPPDSGGGDSGGTYTPELCDETHHKMGTPILLSQGDFPYNATRCGTYILKENIVIPSSADYAFRVSAPGVTLWLAGHSISVTGCGSAAAGLKLILVRSSRFTFKDGKLLGCRKGTGISALGTPGGPLRDLQITNITVSNFTTNANITLVRNMTIGHCVITNATAGGLPLSDTTTPITDILGMNLFLYRAAKVSIHDSEITNDDGESYMIECENVRVSKTTLKPGQMGGMHVGTGRHFLFENCLFDVDNEENGNAGFQIGLVNPIYQGMLPHGNGVFDVRIISSTFRATRSAPGFDSLISVTVDGMDIFDCEFSMTLTPYISDGEGEYSYTGAPLHLSTYSSFATRNVTIRQCSFVKTSPSAIVVDGGVDSVIIEDTYVRSVYDYDGSYQLSAAVVTAGTHVQILNSDFVRCTRGVYVQPGSNHTTIEGCIIEAETEPAILVAVGAGETVINSNLVFGDDS